MKVYVNGKFVDSGKATVSIHDAGLQHGVGLFETMQAFNGRVFELEAHIARLIVSAADLGLSNRLKQDPLCELVETTLKENGLYEARVRLTVTAGDTSLLKTARAAASGKQPTLPDPTIICEVEDPPRLPAGSFEQGIRVVIADAKANPLDPQAGHKTLDYWSRLRELAAAATKQAGEALWFTVSNHLCSGCVSNVFIVKDQQLFTPVARGEEEKGSLRAPVLPGITRAAIIDLADELNLPVHQRTLSINDVLEADELFLTNSNWQVLPVTSVEAKPIGGEADAGSVGAITAQLREALLNRIADRTGGDET
jgi:branched-subunit amino acid aminotransferase/4-amino-4-deoxychorismate lyase